MITLAAINNLRELKFLKSRNFVDIFFKLYFFKRNLSKIPRTMNRNNQYFFKFKMR